MMTFLSVYIFSVRKTKVCRSDRSLSSLEKAFKFTLSKTVLTIFRFAFSSEYSFFRALSNCSKTRTDARYACDRLYGFSQGLF